MKKFILLSVVLLPFFSMADARLKEYEFVRSASRIKTSDSYSSIALDLEFYRHLDNNYSNLLIIDENNSAVPFAVTDLKEKKSFTREIIRANKITAFSVDQKKNCANLTVTLEQENTVNAIEFETDISRFDKKISITFYDADGKVIRKDSNLALYQYDRIFGKPLLRFGTIKTAGMDIVINNFIEEQKSSYTAETVSGNERSSTQNIRKIEFKFKKLKVLEIQNIQSSTAAQKITVDLPEISRINTENETKIETDAAFAPVSGLEISADDKYFSRLMRITFVDADGKNIMQTHAHISQDVKSVFIPQQRCAKYIICIVNNDDAPLKNIKLKWQMNKKVMVMAPNSAQQLKIYYGGKAEKKNYDLEKYVDHLPHEENIFRLEKGVKSPFYAPEIPRDKIYSYIMWAVLGMAAFILLAIIIKLLMSSDGEPKTDLQDMD